jgi:hypothetical protein
MLGGKPCRGDVPSQEMMKSAKAKRKRQTRSAFSLERYQWKFTRSSSRARKCAPLDDFLIFFFFLLRISSCTTHYTGIFETHNSRRHRSRNQQILTATATTTAISPDEDSVALQTDRAKSMYAKVGAAPDADDIVVRYK